MAEPVETPIGTVMAEYFRPGHVRHQVIVGPKFLYALFNPHDQMHPVSRAFMEFVRDGDLPYRRLVVNDHIVDEAATRLKKQASMRNAASFLTTLDDSTLYHLDDIDSEFIPASSGAGQAVGPARQPPPVAGMVFHHNRFGVTRVPIPATESVRAGLERQGAVDKPVVHTAITRIPMGPH